MKYFQIYLYYKIKLHAHGGLKYVRYIQMTNSYTSALWIKQLIVCFLFGEVMNKLGNSLTKHGEDMSSCYIPSNFEHVYFLLLLSLKTHFHSIYALMKWLNWNYK